MERSTPVLYDSYYVCVCVRVCVCGLLPTLLKCYHMFLFLFSSRFFSLLYLSCAHTLKQTDTFLPSKLAKTLLAPPYSKTSEYENQIPKLATTNPKILMHACPWFLVVVVYIVHPFGGGIAKR